MSEQQQLQGVAGLKKHDIKVSGIVFMLYCLVAAGAFGIEEMIPEAGPGMTLLLLCVFPFIWAYPISSLVAECSSVMPSEGGVYVWAKEAFGEFWGFQTGWWATVSTYITNGVYGRLVNGKDAYANKSIFLPAAGGGYDSGLGYPGSYGDYWSSAPDSDYSYGAWYLVFDSSNFSRDYLNSRYNGKSVRPVRGFAE